MVKVPLKSHIQLRKKLLLQKRDLFIIKKVIPTTKVKESSTTSVEKCSICNGIIDKSSSIKADGGKTLICKKCFTKLF